MWGGTVDFYLFDEPAVNTFDKERADEIIKEAKYKFIERKVIKMRTLEEVLDEKCRGQHIDVMDVDIEGLDMDVLKSNNWDKYSPTVLMCEISTLMNLEGALESDVVKYMKSVGYELYYVLYNTLVFRKTK